MTNKNDSHRTISVSGRTGHKSECLARRDAEFTKVDLFSSSQLIK